MTYCRLFDNTADTDKFPELLGKVGLDVGIDVGDSEGEELMVGMFVGSHDDIRLGV
jgi:hypothetical protein